MGAGFGGFLEPRPARTILRYRDLQLRSTELWKLRGNGLEHHGETRQSLRELGALREHDATFHRRFGGDGFNAGDAVVETGLRIHESGAARTVHERPRGHLVPAEHVARDVTHVDDD